MWQRKIESKRFHQEFDQENLGTDQLHLYHYYSILKISISDF